MECKNFFFTSLFLVCLLMTVTSLTLGFGDVEIQDNKPMITNRSLSINKTTSLEMYDNLEKYSEIYDIPKYIFYNIAFLETRYRGPFDWSYNQSKTSCVGALGPMQVMPSTANLVHKTKVSKEKLKNDIRFNIETSAILLNKLYKQYKDWAIVCGCYNTGKPIINGYAKFCVSNLDYRKNWVYIP